MSPEILGVIVGGLISLVSSLVGALLNHHLTLRRDKKKNNIALQMEQKKKILDRMEELDKQGIGMDNPEMQKLAEAYKRPLENK
jgi:formiminotetrahydrofolate cyclodeaminase